MDERNATRSAGREDRGNLEASSAPACRKTKARWMYGYGSAESLRGKIRQLLTRVQTSTPNSFGFLSSYAYRNMRTPRGPCIRYIQYYVDNDTPFCVSRHLFRRSITARFQTILWMQRRSRRSEDHCPPFFRFFASNLPGTRVPSSANHHYRFPLLL